MDYLLLGSGGRGLFVASGYCFNFFLILYFIARLPLFVSANTW